MANPIINDFSVVMGSYSEAPVVNISFKLQDADGDTCHIDPSGGFQYAYASASGVWYDATAHATTPLTDLESYTVAPGRSTALMWDVDTDEPNKDEDFYFRVQTIDSNDDTSDMVISSSFAVDTVAPTVGITLDAYTNQLTYTFGLNVTGSPSHYRVSESASMSGVSWQVYTGADVAITFTSSTQEEKTVYVQVRDEYFNLSSIISDSIIYHTTGPDNTFARINGSIPSNEYYTGISVDSDGVFTPDRTATLDLYAEDLYDIQMYIDGDIDDGADIRTWIDFKLNGSVVKNSVDIVFSGLDYNYDATGNVSITFRDEALNETVVNKSIRVNTKILSCANGLLRDETTEYAHQVLKVNQSGNTTIIDPTRSLEDTYIRKWSEVFYPTSHDYPRNADGTINEAACISLGESSNATYDAVDLSGGAVVYDTEDRPRTVDWTDDGTKDYEDLESSYQAGLRYWIIDNTGYGDIDLEFEHFHLDSNVYGPPYNNIAPYSGDCLVLYDASAAGATQEVYGPTGDTEYTLLDSSKLTEMYAYTGEGNQVVELSTGYSVNADTYGAFTVPTIRGINRVCLVLYTDASHASSGFKLKAGPKYNTTFRNFDVDEKNGEVWIHEYPNGQAYSGDVRMIYDYYDTDVTVDEDAGEVTFAVDPSGVVTTDYTYYIPSAYKLAEDTTRLFVSTIDDFVDYLEPDLYVTPDGGTLNKNANYEFGYPTSPAPSGYIAANYTVDKDRGVVEFYDGTNEYGDEYAYVPGGRLSLDFFHHTYKRLSNDGYGVLEFRDETIVADNTPLFPDYTWVDVKIVNEGDAVLEDGRLLFLSRGYDNDADGIIDEVLDINRPWDVQEGTSAETYSKTAMQVAQNYTFNDKPTKSEAMSILSAWQGASFGFDVNARTKFFGRVVWVIGGTGGSSYPTTSIGRKTFSAEIEGKYYNIES